MKTDLILHDYWRSGAAYRVRIALNLKGLDYKAIGHDLRVGAQKAEDYLTLSPQGLIPALQTGDGVIIQSMAIIEWLDETWAEPKLLPADPASRAIVRAMAQIIACDIHPLNNLRVLNTLRADLNINPQQQTDWITRWIGEGFTGLEHLVGLYGKGFCFGDSPTIADCCLIPQIYSANRFGVDLTCYPNLLAVAQSAAAIEAFRLAAPENQPDAPKETC